MKRTLALIFWWGVLYPAMASGQEEPAEDKAGAPLSLEAAVKEALSKNADIRAAEASLAAARGGATGQSAIQNQPQLVLESGASGDGFDFFTISLEQELLTGGKRKVAKTSGEARVGVLDAKLSQRKAEVAARAARAYIDFWAAAEGVEVASARAQDAKAAREAAQKRSTAGDLSALEALLAEAEEERAQAALAKAEGEMEAARAAFAAVLGRRPSAPLVVLPPEPLADAPSADALLTALEEAPRLKSSQKSVEVAAARLDAAKRALAPNPLLKLGGGVARTIFEADDFVGDPGALTSIESSDVLFVLELSVPLPVFRKGYAGDVEEEKGLLAAEEAERDAQRRDLSAALLAARARLSAAQKAEALLAKAVPRYEEAEALAKKGYEGGALGIDALLLARERAFGARSDYLAARAATLRARIDIFALLGKIPSS